MKPIKKSITYGRHQLTLETGEIARQAHGAVVVTMDDTVVLVTVVGAKNTKPEQDFFPLTVDYQEKFTPRAEYREVFSSAKAVHLKKKH